MIFVIRAGSLLTYFFHFNYPPQFVVKFQSAVHALPFYDKFYGYLILFLITKKRMICRIKNIIIDSHFFFLIIHNFIRDDMISTRFLSFCNMIDVDLIMAA